ncbi:MAG: metallophosphoesterase family protein, partial [SAR202 cluster bacterium]|nr:metallophosphoesterase family protein [SAR202 cluster bacterium]
MRALIVSDVHANLEALESVVEFAKSNGGFDQV